MDSIRWNKSLWLTDGHSLDAGKSERITNRFENDSIPSVTFAVEETAAADKAKVGAEFSSKLAESARFNNPVVYVETSEAVTSSSSRNNDLFHAMEEFLEQYV